MSDRRTADDIEREIEAERGELARSLDELQRQVSPEAIVERVSGLLREHGGDLADNAVRQAKGNPVALAVTGAGLAWLIAGPTVSRSSKAGTYDRWAATHDTSVAPRQPEPPKALPKPRHQPQIAYDHREYETTPGFRHAPEPKGGFKARLDRISAQMPPRPPRGAGGRPYRTVEEHDAEEKKSLREKFKEGTENMSESARDRLAAAREAAWNAEQRLEAVARDYAATGREAYGNQPIIAGLLAFGVGAAIGLALPRTRQEDRYLGSYRDKALAEAERIYHSEKAKLRAVAEAAAEEAKAVATETLEQVKSGASEAKGAVADAEKTAKSAGERIADAAKSEAERRDLGGSVG
ncbi:DUF3618 domain-containing protein [Jannaschia rubra]|uniref:DUF3618 domain-containing protein n=1 Tax=Jannaschia rubra TaxID=282197 RepID=A0A0M6XMM5_9RHOB|nr:DUF3618 domain-containing protein [Jannaschia rubra]CTQ31461.1 hypothetical protein JAN5088_00219 [Jannaschia rubra]SFF79000.1 Protein of unknown function [Jannaschia rubra]